VKDPLEKYELLGAIVGGFVFGFLVFGAIALYLCSSFDLPSGIALAVAVLGAIGGAYSQVKRGDTLWEEVSRYRHWWWW
jgi:hypothetical protein